MKKYNLALAHTWEYDKEIVDLTRKLLKGTGIRTLFIGYQNFRKISELIVRNQIEIDYFWDRATDDDEEFNIVASPLKQKSYIINDYKAVEFSVDKATMHLELINKGVNSPYTIIIPPYNLIKEIHVDPEQIENLGTPFIIKPANTTGGGVGVVKGAESFNDILLARQLHKNDKYLLQKKITPKIIDEKRFWFRCFYAFGEVIICWWDDQTHIYDLTTEAQIEKFNLAEMETCVKKIHEVCKLNFFSTEIAMTESGNFVAIDYVNEVCDMRLKSNHPDGVPDKVIIRIILNLFKFIKNGYK